MIPLSINETYKLCQVPFKINFKTGRFISKEISGRTGYFF